MRLALRSIHLLMKIHPTNHNLELASAMLEEMEDYLLSNEVFWPLKRSVGRAAPRLTLGALLLTLDQLEAMRSDMSPAQDASFEKLIMQMDLVCGKHAVALERKAGREAGSRLNLWRGFVNDLEESPSRAGSYAYEVRHRVMLTRLVELGPESADLHTALESAGAVDQRLRLLFTGDAFVWDSRLQGTYPPDEYWHLYGHPRKED